MGKKLDSAKANIATSAQAQDNAPAAQADTLTQDADIAEGSPMAKFLASSDYTDKLLTLSKRWDRALQFKCDEAAALDGKLGAVTIERPVDMPASAKAPVTGSWRQRFTVKRCGKTHRHYP